MIAPDDTLLAEKLRSVFDGLMSLIGLIIELFKRIMD